MLAFAVGPAIACADTIGVINDLRANGCKQSERSAALRPNEKLAAAAKHLSNDVVLRDALERSGYRADQSGVIRISGTVTDDSLRRVLSKNYCDTIADAALTEVGIHQTAQSVSIVFAAPFAPPLQRDASAVAARVLQLVNEARSQPRRCGRQKLAAAKPLSMNKKLQRAALLHAQDMAKRDRASHEGSDGSAPGDRARRVGYAWSNVGENIAAGHLSAEEVVAGWVSSPGHCANLMDPDFTQMGVAYVTNTKSSLGIYWAQVFGRPQ